MKNIQLHLGCGNKILDGWVNLDIQPGVGVDIVDNASTLSKIENSSCSIIYASHILEHFGRAEITDVLQTWTTKLKKGGILRLSVPDFTQVIKRYNQTEDLSEVLGLLVGGQRDKYDIHKMVFDKNILTNYLIKLGYCNIKSWDWRKTNHHNYDDYSQAYLPHMEKESGMLMSLNLEAVKE